MICPRCKQDKEEVGDINRDYTGLCSDCFAKGFVASIFGEKKASETIEPSAEAPLNTAKGAPEKEQR